ncbi:MAG: hypothetical protein JRJ00_10970 [Deltaproteobacteria bacterium]|nr:hypothetical protein [Deltaproteobacteria bacterium]
MTKKLKCVITLILVLYACSSFRYHTTFEGSYDQAYDLKNKKICFIPWYWTEWGKENNVTQLTETTIYSYFKKELEGRQLKVEYIDSKDLIHDKKENTMGIRDTINCDCTLNLYYSQNADTATTPEKSPASSQVSSDDLNYYNLYIIGTLWTAQNEIKGIWRGSITKQSPIPNLDQHAEKMVEKLFKKEFPKIK